MGFAEFAKSVLFAGWVKFGLFVSPIRTQPSGNDNGGSGDVIVWDLVDAVVRRGR